MQQTRLATSSAALAAALLTGPASPLPALAQMAPIFEQRYDRFKDYTSLKLDLGIVIRGSNHKVKFSIHQIFQGEGRNEKVGSTRICLNSDSDDGWVYLEFHPVTLLVDGERMRFDPEHDGTVGKGYVLEYMWVRPSESQVHRLLEASKIEGQVGIHEFKLNPGQVAAIKEFAALIDSPDRPVPSGQFVPAPPPPKPKSPEEIARDKEAQRLEAARRQEETRRREEENRRRQEAELNDKLDQKLRLGKALEKSNTKGAIQYYEEVVNLALNQAWSEARTA